MKRRGAGVVARVILNEVPMQSVGPHDVAQFAGCVPLPTIILCGLGGRMGELLCRIVLGVWYHSLLGGIMGSTGDDDNTAILIKVRAQEVEEQSVSYVVDGKCLLNIVFRVLDAIQNL